MCSWPHLSLFVVLYPVDKISSTNPRVIEDIRARQLCVDVRHCVFYETCATYGLNVDRVFQEGKSTDIEYIGVSSGIQN